MNASFVELLSALAGYASSSFLVLKTAIDQGNIDATIEHSLRKAAEAVKDASN